MKTAAPGSARSRGMRRFGKTHRIAQNSSVSRANSTRPRKRSTRDSRRRIGTCFPAIHAVSWLPKTCSTSVSRRAASSSTV